MPCVATWPGFCTSLVPRLAQGPGYVALRSEGRNLPFARSGPGCLESGSQAKEAGSLCPLLAWTFRPDALANLEVVICQRLGLAGPGPGDQLSIALGTPIPDTVRPLEALCPRS